MKRLGIEQLWRDDVAGARLSRAALVPASWLFRTATWVRNRLYDQRLLAVERADAPVVCVGNLTVGGSGKTPLVIWLVERLLERGRRPVVVSRGYASAARRTTAVATPLPSQLPAGVSAVDSREPAGPLAGDEAVLVARRTGIPVVTGADRIAACRTALAMYDADIIVLDDGFQHRRLHRDLDIVIVDEADRAALVLPAGPLREGMRALERADFVVDTGRGAAPGSITMEGAPEALVARVSREAELESLSRLKGAAVLAIAGIARPRRFIGMLESHGAQVIEAHVFADHHNYTLADWETLDRAAERADLIVTTEKDLVKLEAFASRDSRPPLRALRYGVSVEGADALLERIGGFDVREMRPHHFENGG